MEAETLEEALEKAIETANADDAMALDRPLKQDFRGRRLRGRRADPRDTDAAWPVPERFTERGEPPVVTLTDPGRPGGGAIEVSRGRVLLRFQTPDATLTSEVSDPPHPPGQPPPRHRSAAAPTARPTSP